MGQQPGFRRWIARGFTLLSIGAALTAPGLATAGEVSFIAPTLVVQESATAQTYTADVLISDTSTSDIINDFQLDLFLQSTTVFNSASPGSTSDTNIAYGATTGFDLSTATVSPAGGLVISNTAAEPYLYNNSDPNNQNNSAGANGENPPIFPIVSDYTTTLAGPNQASVNEVYPDDSWANVDAAEMLQTWALARLYITVAPGFTGTEYLVWNNNGTANDPFAPFYSLSTATTTNLDPTLVMGSITVVPEPSAVVLMLLGSLGACAVAYRRRRMHRG